MGDSIKGVLLPVLTKLYIFWIMKRWILLLALFSVKNLAMAQANTFTENTRIYLVRHAEKETGRDPVLTEAGRKRAGDLMRTLAKLDIRRIYVTAYRRSWMTADSLRIQLKIDTVVYDADTTGMGLLTKMKVHADFGKSILVVGHTNTLPPILRALGVENFTVAELPDEEFDNLFIVEYKNGKVLFEQKKYGVASGKSAPMKEGQ